MVATNIEYKTLAIEKLLLDDEVNPLFPYKSPIPKKSSFRKYEYVYDDMYDCYLRPANKMLKYSTTNRAIRAIPENAYPVHTLQAIP